MSKRTPMTSTPVLLRSSDLSKSGSIGSSVTDSPSYKLIESCPSCQSRFLKRDLRDHTSQVCERMKSMSMSMSTTLPSFSWEHGFITTSHHLFAQNVKCVVKESIKNNDKLTTFALMNAFAMELIQVREGDIVFIRDEVDIVSIPVFESPNIKNVFQMSVVSDVLQRKSPSDADDSHDRIPMVLIKGSGDVTPTPIPAIIITGYSKVDDLDLYIKYRNHLMNQMVFNSFKTKVDDEEITIRFPDDEVITQSLDQMNLESSTWTLFPPLFIFNAMTRIVPDTTAGDEWEEDIVRIKGLDRQIKKLMDSIVLPTEKSDLIDQSKWPTPRGILLHGFTGTGKSHVLRYLKKKLSHLIWFITLDASTVTTKLINNLEQLIKESSTSPSSPSCCIIFDHLDQLVPFKKTMDTNKTASSFLHFIDSMRKHHHRLVMVGVTSSVDSVDSTIRKPRRFDLEIEFTIPMATDRVDIVMDITSRMNLSVEESFLREKAETAFSFTGADLYSAFDHMNLNSIECGRHQVTEEDVTYGFKVTKPSAMKEVTLQVPCVLWSDIGGVEQIRKEIDQLVIWPFKHPHRFTQLGINPGKGILMYGPPGCSKTMIGQAIATESKLNFIAIKGAELLDKYVGESEKAVRTMFRKARQAAPSVLFFDEIDAFAPERGSSSGSSGHSVSNRVCASLLTEMDGIEKGAQVIVVAATNRPDMIDDALLRPGRFDTLLYVPLPDVHGRMDIFRIKTSKMPTSDDVDINQLATMTEGYSGAEVTSVIAKGALLSMNELMSKDDQSDEPIKVTMKHFTDAINKVMPRTKPESIRYFEKFNKNK